MLELKEIKYNTSDYELSLKLRNKVMREPLGFNLFDEDLSYEKDTIMVGCFDNDTIIGVGVMSYENTTYKLECLCVDFVIQKQGIGSKIIMYLEDYAVKQGAKKLCMDARVIAQKFYMKHGYVASGETYLHEHAPVEHIYMEKDL